MALKSDDILLVQRGDQSYQMPASQLGASDSEVAPDLQSVTDKGNTTTNDVVLGDDPSVGATNYGLMFRATGGIIARRVNGTDNVFSGGTNGQNDTSVIKANGSASFSGNVDVGELDVSSTTTQGSRVRPEGIFNLQRPASTPNTAEFIDCFYGDTQTFRVEVDGSAEFAGGDIQLNADGTGSFSSQLSATNYVADEGTGGKTSLFLGRVSATNVFAVSAENGAGGSGSVLIGGSDALANPNIQLNADGSATFQDDVVVGVGGFGNNVELFSDGNIRVRNTVQAGPNAWENDRNGVRMSDSGLLEINHHNTSPESTAALTLRRAGAVNAQILGGGSAQFLGPLTGGSSSDISSSPAGTTQGVIGVTSSSGNGNAEAAVVGRNLSAGGRVFCGVTSEGTQVTTSEIFENGSASFDGAVKGSMTSITNGGAWDLKESNFWTAAGGTLANPTNVEEAQTGVIYVAAELNSFGNQFSFPGGVTPTIPANSVVPYYVDVNNKIRLGFATEAFV